MNNPAQEGIEAARADYHADVFREKIEKLSKDEKLLLCAMLNALSDTDRPPALLDNVQFFTRSYILKSLTEAEITDEKMQSAAQILYDKLR